MDSPRIYLFATVGGLCSGIVLLRHANTSLDVGLGVAAFVAAAISAARAWRGFRVVAAIDNHPKRD